MIHELSAQCRRPLATRVGRWLAVLFLVPMAAAAPPIDPAQMQSAGAAFTGFVDEQFKSGGFPSFSVGVVRGSELVYARAVGLADRETAREATTATLYRIGSVTKVMTATLLTDLREDGVVTLDDPIAKYLPDGVVLPTYGDAKGVLRLSHLATHSSGLPRLPVNLSGDARDPYAGYSAAQLYAGLSEMRLLTPPGTRFAYSNLGSALLGHVLEKAAAKPYEALLRERVLTPLEMQATTITLPESALFDGIAAAYGGDDAPVTEWDLGVLAPAGAVISNVPDLAKFVAWQLEPDEVAGPFGADAVAMMQRAHFVVGDRRSAAGLGWMLKGGRGETGDLVWHNGGTAGFASYVGLAPDQNVGVIVLANSARSVTEMGETFLKLAAQQIGYAEEPAVDAAVTAKAEALARLIATPEAPELAELFAPQFLAQVPLAQVQLVMKQLGGELGACQGVVMQPADEPGAGVAAFRFANNQVRYCHIAVDASKAARIIGLRMLPIVEPAEPQ